MERDLLVELSPNEETALHRIAQGMMLTADMEPQHLARLKQLALIEERGTDFRLTDLGRHRLATRGMAPGRRLATSREERYPSPIALAGSSGWREWPTPKRSSEIG